MCKTKLWINLKNSVMTIIIFKRTYPTNVRGYGQTAGNFPDHTALLAFFSHKHEEGSTKVLTHSEELLGRLGMLVFHIQISSIHQCHYDLYNDIRKVTIKFIYQQHDAHLHQFYQICRATNLIIKQLFSQLFVINLL